MYKRRSEFVVLIKKVIDVIITFLVRTSRT